MVGEHNPTAAGAVQAGPEFSNHGLGLDQDVSRRPTLTTGTHEPSPRSASERDRQLKRGVVTFVVVATGSAINGINSAAMPRFRLSKPDHDR